MDLCWPAFQPGSPAEGVGIKLSQSILTCHFSFSSSITLICLLCLSALFFKPLAFFTMTFPMLPSSIHPHQSTLLSSSTLCSPWTPVSQDTVRRGETRLWFRSSFSEWLLLLKGQLQCQWLTNLCKWRGVIAMEKPVQRTAEGRSKAGSMNR